jgi:DNA-binding response OmpR family regulator
VGIAAMTAHKTILIVEDDVDLRETLAGDILASGWYRVRSAGTIADAASLALARDSRIDLILLDVELPDGDGRDLCLRLRRAGVKVPVIMLTGSDSEVDVVAGLDAGANDCVLKPFRLAELMARLRAQLRTFESSEDVAFRIGPYVFRPATKTLQDPASNRRIRLTEKEAAVLKYLYRAEGRPVCRHTLLHEVWGYNPSADSHTVETHIYRLRRKLEQTPGEIRILVNVGGGYRLCSDDADTALHAPSQNAGLRFHPSVQQAA